MVSYAYSYSKTIATVQYEYRTGNMVDFSFIVSLYVSDLPNVTISTVPYRTVPVLVDSLLPVVGQFIHAAGVDRAAMPRKRGAFGGKTGNTLV